MKKKIIILVITLFVFVPFTHVNAETFAEYVTGLVETDSSVVADDPDSNPRYIGANPNNYVSFNNEYWRILGVFDGKIKIVRMYSLGKYAWDSTDNSINGGNGINEWSQSKLMQELNGDYLDNTLTENTYWYNDKNNGKTAVFDHTKVLKTEYQQYITEGVWNTGAFNYDGTTLYEIKKVPVDVSYNNEKNNNISNLCTSATSCNDTVERKNNWTGKVGLVTNSDFVYTTSGNNTTNRESCLQQYSDNGWNYDCSSTSWLYSDWGLWTISPIVERNTNSYTLKSGYRFAIEGYTINTNEVYPVVYLKPNTKVYGGNGTQANPYVLDLLNAISFNPNGGTDIEPQYLEIGDKVTRPVDPTKEDSDFLGWYTDANFTNEYDFDEEVTDDLTLYAKWKFNYRITEGENQTFDNEDIVIKTNGSLDNLIEIRVNDEVLDESNYELERGSTILTLSNSYLSSLDNGTYNIDFIYNDGSVGTKLIVAKTSDSSNTTNQTNTDNTDATTDNTNNPKTGDNILFYISMLGLSIIGLSGAGLYIKKKRAN